MLGGFLGLLSGLSMSRLLWACKRGACGIAASFDDVAKAEDPEGGSCLVVFMRVAKDEGGLGEDVPVSPAFLHRFRQMYNGGSLRDKRDGIPDAAPALRQGCGPRLERGVFGGQRSRAEHDP